jgi:transcription-repair coupling factor (superfamily II helicase)
LKPGDFVVHVDHGIGRFEGLQTLETGGVSREFMLLIYAENAKLFVPVERLDLVSRFFGRSAAADARPSGRFRLAENKSESQTRDARYGGRAFAALRRKKTRQGFAFSADSPWQEEFEDAFPYQLTTDQATAIEDVKTDMETPVPMDRLSSAMSATAKPKWRCAARSKP